MGENTSLHIILLCTISLLLMAIHFDMTADTGAGYGDFDDRSSFLLSGMEAERAAGPSSWTKPGPERIMGDRFNERAIFVHQNDSTYLDDMLFCAAVPAAVHWEGGTRFESLIISDTKNRENGNLIGDYREYLGKTGARPEIDIIGPVEIERESEILGYFPDLEDTNRVTTAPDVYEGASDIARYYWSNRRYMDTEKAVLAYVPESDGGREVREGPDASADNRFEITNDIDASETGWLRFSIQWEDPQADTDYRIGIRDPYALHQNSYTNIGEEGHVNPTNNKLFDHEGYVEIGMAPYYSFMPYSLDGEEAGGGSKQFTGTLPRGDGSIWPLKGASDLRTFTFGPVRKGDWIGAMTNWTYYNVNETTYRDLNTYIYLPSQEVGPEYHLEMATNDHTYKSNDRTTPELGYCYAEEDGYYTITVHPYVDSAGGSFQTYVAWGALDEISPWTAGQVNWGNDPVRYDFMEYQYLRDDVSESVINGAVAASLDNIPMFYTAGGVPEDVVVRAMEEMGIGELVIIDPGNRIDPSGWEDIGMGISHLSTDRKVFDHIYSNSQDRGLDRSLVITAQGGPWFSGAALGGAYHGAPVPALDDQEAKDLQIGATTMWWQVIQDSTVFRKAPSNMYANPSQKNMEELADGIYGWLSGFHEDMDPSCGDIDGNGVPDNGRNWDYSDDIDVLVVSPMNALKPVFDRAMSGKASVGRISPAEPEVLWAVLNREMLYWKVGFSRSSNPDDPDDQTPIEDHWNRAVWTFNTYAHDDDIVDYDAGDQDDDDWCGVDDGGRNHLPYKTREDLPEYAFGSGRESEFHTYYDDILEALEDGTVLWSNHGHGHAYWMLETGPGFTGTGADPSDPPWGGPVPDNGFVDPPLEVTSGWDWYYGLDNVHSSFSTYQSCQVGGSALSEYFLRLGGIGVIGGYVTRSLVEATIQSDRTTQGLFLHNMTFGEAHRWGQDEIGCIYSLKDPGPVFRNYREEGYPDDVDFRYGDTGHTILYGDPSLRLLSSTLFVNSDISISEDGEFLVADLQVIDQSGRPQNPDSTVVIVNDEEVECTKVSSGRYEARWKLPGNISSTEVKVIIRDNEHLSPGGTHDFIRTYEIQIPSGSVEIGDIDYIGGLDQIITGNGPVCFPSVFGEPVLPRDLNSIGLDIWSVEGDHMACYEELFFDGSSWIVGDIDVSALPEGTYVVYVKMGLKHIPAGYFRGPEIRIDHIVFFEGGELQLDRWSKEVQFIGLAIRSTFGADGTVLPDVLEQGSYEFQMEAGGDFEDTDVEGELVFDPSTMTYGFLEDMSTMPLCMYRVVITAKTPYSEEAVHVTSNLSLDVPITISNFRTTYSGGMTQTITVDDVQFYHSQQMGSVVDPSRVVQARCRVLFPDRTATPVSGSIENVDGAWLPLVLNVSSLRSGEYLIGVEVRTEEFGTNLTVSGPIDIRHVLEVGAPDIHYDDEEYTLDLRDIRVVSSYILGEVLPTSVMLKSVDDERFTLDLTQDIRFGGGVWYVRNLGTRSKVPEGGGYFVEMSFWSDGTLGTRISDTFLISYDLVISPPTLMYDSEYDMVQIMGLSILSEYGEGRLLTESELVVKDLEVLNSSSGEVLEEYELYFADGQFYRDITNPADRYGDGEYRFRATFSTLHSGNHSVTSGPLLLLGRSVDIIPGDDDAPTEDREGDSSGGLLVILSILMVLVMASLVFLGFIIRKKREKPVVIREHEPPGSPRVSIPLKMDEIGSGAPGRGQLGGSGSEVPLLQEASVEYFRPEKKRP